MSQPPLMPLGYPPPFMMPDMGITNPIGVNTNSECSCSECAESSSTSTSSSSSSSSSDSSGCEIEPGPINPMRGPYYNYEFCTCDIPLPESYVPKPAKKKKPKYKGEVSLEEWPISWNPHFVPIIMLHRPFVLIFCRTQSRDLVRSALLRCGWILPSGRQRSCFGPDFPEIARTGSRSPARHLLLPQWSVHISGAWQRN